MAEDITAGLRECAALDWIDSTFAAATMREAADEIERLRGIVASAKALSDEAVLYPNGERARVPNEAILELRERLAVLAA